MAEVWHAYLNMDAYSNYDNYGDEDVCDVDFYNNDSWLIPQEDGTYVIITGLEYQLDIRYYGSVVMTQVGYGDEPMKKRDYAFFLEWSFVGLRAMFTPL